jgi:hypothetical protein
MPVSALHIWIWGFTPILPYRFSQALVKLDGERRGTAIFKFFRRFSMGFKSGLWLKDYHIFALSFG